MKRAVLLLMLSGALACAAQKRPVTAADVVSPEDGVANSIRWSPDSSRFAILENDVVSVYTVKTASKRDVISMARLERAAAKMPAHDTADWIDRHTSETKLQWFADSRRLLVAAGGDLFIVDANKGSFETLVHTPEEEQDAKLSSDNRSVAFRRGHDLYAVDVETKSERRLTEGGSGTLLNGETDWVYPEELDLDTAYWWSPDSRSIAYLQFDVSHEPVFPQVSLMQTHGVVEPERYPKAGDPNAIVRLGVVAATGGKTKWMDSGAAEDHLLARVVWSPDSREILVERLNRVQNRLDLLLANCETGAAQMVLHEEDRYWINLGEAPRFLAGGDRFLWTSERSGFRHLYIEDLNGKSREQLTNGDWAVDQIAGVDEKRELVYYTSTEDSPIERQLYVVKFDGSGKRKLSIGAGTHAASLSPDGTCYLEDFSSVSSPVKSVVYGMDGKQIGIFRVNGKPDLDLQPVENVTMKTADGTLLYGQIVRPAGFEAKQKYPAVIAVYGGPDVQRVTNAWAGVNMDQLLAARGFVVWHLDNRGSAGRGHAFEAPIFHEMGEHELADQKEGIQHLISMGFVDPARIGMTGWSYGGYMTLYTVTHAPELLRAAVAGAPVTDWRNYDSIYTERYMGLPSENVAGYAASSPVGAAAAMGDTKLLILHNIEDDNVHFQNTMQMAGALENAGKLFYMTVYPGKTHGVQGPAKKQMIEETVRFFEENLK
ncbi:MAG TPA: S9 family peptidase [Bryobacteraceae bacterium]|nr:S9 family peptidase [Bryobacteraceae bacterium]